MLSWVFGNSKKKPKKNAKPRPSYDEAKTTASKGSVEQRKVLAAYEDMDPEILYFLTGDTSGEVRTELAKNDGNPLQADVILATDVDPLVRSELAYKIGRLLPELTNAENQRLTELTFEVLEILAKDNLPAIRKIISEEIKLLVDIPKKIVQELARDVEEAVSAPVLEFSPLLSSKELIQIIASGVQGNALAAIARRDGLAEQVSDSVVDTDDVNAIAVLLANETASISEKALDAIGLKAPEKPTWHRPLVERKNLSKRTVMRIATFVSAILVETLISRNKLGKDVEHELRQAVRKRIDTGKEKGIRDIDDQEEQKDERIPADERARALRDAGELNEEAIVRAIKQSDLALIPHALHFMSSLSLNSVSKMLKSDSGKAIVSLAWKSGLNFDVALSLQRHVAKVRPKSIVGDTNKGQYPMSEDDMEWYIEYFS